MFGRRKYKNRRNFAYKKPIRQLSFSAPALGLNFNKITKIFFFVVMFISALIAGHFLTKYNNFPIEKVRIIATYEHIEPQQLRDLVNSSINGGFFDLDVVSLQQHLQQIPWVYAVYIKREWPNTIVVSVEEQKALAQWKDDALLNDKGDIFVPAKETFPANLPLLEADDVNNSRDVFANYMKMRQILDPLGLQIKHLIFNEHHFWNLLLNDDINLFVGDEDTMEHLENLAKIYPKLLASNPHGKIQSIDLRYRDGVAVKWE